MFVARAPVSDHRERMTVSNAVNRNPVVLHEPDTWPSSVRAALPEGAEVLRAHALCEATGCTLRNFARPVVEGLGYAPATCRGHRDDNSLG